jgi:hypothetical protein
MKTLFALAVLLPSFTLRGRTGRWVVRDENRARRIRAILFLDR